MSENVKYIPAYWKGTKLAYPHVPKEHPKFAESVVAGNIIFISGCQGQNDETGEKPDDFVVQMNNALDKVRKAMENAGSEMNNVVKTLIMLKDVKNYPLMRKTEVEYWEKYAPKLVEDPPASTFLECNLAHPGLQVEIDVVGVVSRD